MNRRLTFAAGMILLLAWTCPAATEVATSTLDGGGGRSSAGSYVNDGCIGGVGGISSASADAARHGFIGQIVDVTSLSVTGTPVQVNETATSQLSGTAVMDDDTVTVAEGSEIAWAAPAWPLSGIDTNGLATAATVYDNTAGSVTGQYQGVTGEGLLTVLDVLPDNYGSYAGDGLPDSWQNQHFGLDNLSASPLVDADGDGQNNEFEWVAGLVPTNSASRFIWWVENVAGQPTQKKLVFSPRWSDRTYSSLFRADLTGGADWTNLTAATTNDNGTERSVTDLSATESNKFYRISISYP